MALKIILEPITINQTVIKNRIARTAHGEHLDFMQYGGDNMIAYHLARAKGECTIRSRSGLRKRVVPADTVVLVTSNEPNRELFDALQGKVNDIAIIGDALSPRGMQESIAEGHRAARNWR